jgi:hypothetical protein
MSTGGRRWAPRSVRGELAEGLCRYDFKIRGGNSASADLGILRGGGSAEPTCQSEASHDALPHHRRRPHLRATQSERAYTCSEEESGLLRTLAAAAAAPQPQLRSRSSAAAALQPQLCTPTANTRSIRVRFSCFFMLYLLMFYFVSPHICSCFWCFYKWRNDNSAWYW